LAGAFDQLLLALDSPRGVYIYLHDGSFGVASTGVNSQVFGHDIMAVGPMGEEHHEIALDAILAKFDASDCRLLAVVRWR